MVLRFLPMLLLMYMLAYFDRVNIGFAEASMKVDLGVSSAAFALGAGLFFIGYAAVEIPGNFIMARVGARLWFSRIMVTFGLIAMATAFVHSGWSFFLLRSLLGVAEGGLFPAMVLFLTYWIPGSYRARVMGVLIFGAPLAFIFGSPLTAALLSLDGLAGLHGWQIMFIATGLATVAVGIWAFLYFDDVPARARFLTDRQRFVLQAEMAGDRAEREKISPKGLRGAITDWRIYFFAAIFFGIQVGIFGVTFYMSAQIARSAGQKPGLVAGSLTAIPWSFAILAIVLVTRFAGRRGNRGPLACACLLLGGLGVVAGTAAHTPLLSLAAFSLAAAGLISVQPMFWLWPTGMLAGTAATAGLAFVNAVGNLGGFAAPNIKAWVDAATGNPAAGLETLGGVAAAASLLLLFADRVRSSRVPGAPCFSRSHRE